MKTFSFIHHGSEFNTPKKRGVNRQRPPLKGGVQSSFDMSGDVVAGSPTVGRDEIMALLKEQRPDYTEKKLKVSRKGMSMRIMQKFLNLRNISSAKPTPIVFCHCVSHVTVVSELSEESVSR